MRRLRTVRPTLAWFLVAALLAAVVPLAHGCHAGGHDEDLELRLR